MMKVEAPPMLPIWAPARELYFCCSASCFCDFPENCKLNYWRLLTLTIMEHLNFSFMQGRYALYIDNKRFAAEAHFIRFSLKQSFKHLVVDQCCPSSQTKLVVSEMC